MNRNDYILRGASCKCGRCGEGRLFKSYLKFSDECSACGQDFSIADTADGPAFFVGSLASFIFIPIGAAVVLTNDSMQTQMVGLGLVFLFTLIFVLALLPIAKGILFNLQIAYGAEEGKFSSFGTHGSAPSNWKNSNKFKQRQKLDPLK